MAGRKGRSMPKRLGVKPLRLIGFMAIGLFFASILYLAFAPQPIPKGARGGATESVSRRAAIIDQLGLRYPNKAFVEGAKGILTGAGLRVDVYPPEAVTVDLYKAISTRGYRLIVFRVHMGVNDEAIDKPVGLLTSEPHSQFKYQVEQLRNWVASAKAYGTEEVLFAVSPKFIGEASILDYPGAIVIPRS
ncbi:MAG: hypothetical protein QW645_05590 [Candidatus Bathyarchaeia archaeon]